MLASVSILDFISPTDNMAGFQTALNNACAAAGAVEFPPDATFDLPQGTYNFPADRALVMNGGYMRSPWGTYLNVASGHFELSCEGTGKIWGVQINLNGGTPRVRNLRYEGWNGIGANTFGIYMAGTGTYTNAVFDDIEFRSCKYGLMRAGATSTATNTQITNVRGRALLSDLIALDQIVNDRNTLIDGVCLNIIDSGDVKEYDPSVMWHWGMGVSISGLASLGPPPTWTPARDFIVNNVCGSTLAQLLHVEYSQRFEVYNVHGTDLRDSVKNPYQRTDTYPGSGVEPALAAFYGCDDFLASNFRGEGANCDFLVLAGAGRLCSNFELANVHIDHGQVRIDLGGDGFANIRNVRSRGRFILRGRTGDMYFDGIRAGGGAAGGVAPHAISLEFNSSSVPVGSLPTGPCMLRMGSDFDGRGVDGSMSTGTLFTNNQGDILVEGCQRLPNRFASSAPALTGYPVGAVIRATPVAGGKEGWVHIGNGVWKTFGTIGS